MALSPWDQALFICFLPQTPLPFSPPGFCFSVDRRMEDPTNNRNSIKSADEKHSFEDSVNPTWFTSVANATRKFSETLLAWGVEERGAYPIVIFEHGRA